MAKESSVSILLAKLIVYDNTNKFVLNVFFAQKALQCEWFSISV